METVAAYLDRKYDEIALLNACLRSELVLRKPASVAEVIEQKFRLAAALKAEHELNDWKFTETAWAHSGRPRAGPFEFSYDYQRADLVVSGPSFYELHGFAPAATIYTSSGMAAISALLLASARIISEADILVLPGSYGETLELIEGYARHLRMVPIKHPSGALASARGRPRFLLLDSCAPARLFEATLHCTRPALDLVIFDTTCFSSRSGRIRRVLSWARRWQLPIVLVRSHTKLDSLGIEYGRLGSAVFFAGDGRIAGQQGLMGDLAEEARNAVRLFGGAALPAHFPPYVGTAAYQALTARRVAAILRNNRRTARFFASALAGSLSELHFAHGLYVTLAPRQRADETQARQIAADLCAELGKAGMPLRHAGSFGFDFGAAEWFHDRTSDRYVIRIAVPDLPTPLWDQVAQAIAEWWSAHERGRWPSVALDAPRLGDDVRLPLARQKK